MDDVWSVLTVLREEEEEEMRMQAAMHGIEVKRRARPDSEDPNERPKQFGEGMRDG